VLVAGAFACGALAAPASTDQGERGMSDQGVVPALRAMSVNDEPGFEKMAAAISAQCRRDVGELLGLLRSQKRDDSQKAAAVIMNLGPVAFPTVLGTIRRDQPEDYVWEAQLLADIEARSRAALLQELEAMLADKRDVKQPDLGPGVEEKPIPRRVCDEAYVTMRKMLVTGESEDAQYMNERAFLTRSAKEKDAEIARYKTTRKWVKLTE
jgi:hypothetical protein